MTDMLNLRYNGKGFTWIVTGKVMKNYWYMYTSQNRKWEIYTYFMTVTLIGSVKLLSLPEKLFGGLQFSKTSLVLKDLQPGDNMYFIPNLLIIWLISKIQNKKIYEIKSFESLIHSNCVFGHCRQNYLKQKTQITFYYKRLGKWYLLISTPLTL